MSDSPFRMTVDLNVLDHLADGLYSSVAAVLTEAVANAWDADATRVTIDLAIEQDRISIEDDGVGMDVAAVNERYLRVGYRRRAEGDATPGGRSVMGRKGIGKLSLFSIADLIEIQTKAADTEPAGLRIAAEALRQAMASRSPEYKPESITVPDDAFVAGHGTRITVTSLKHARLREVAPESLRRRLARRFSIIGSAGFQVHVNGTAVTIADREDLRFVEYLWRFRDTVVETGLCQHLKQTTELPAGAADWDPAWRLRGWIGTVDKPRRLATPEGNLNSVIVIARGRLVDEDVLGRVSGAEVYTKYLTGQVEADFLDASDVADIVTSNRQRLIEDDARLGRLLTFLRTSIRTIADAWTNLRTQQRTGELRERFPRVGEWLDQLPSGWRTKAEALLKRIAVMDVGGDEEEQESSQRTLLRHAIYGFERLRLRGDAEELEQALAQGVDALLRLLADRDSLEAAFYSDIVSNRLHVISELNRLVDVNSRERVLQDYLFDHLWLLDPAWERATGSEAMEKRLRLLAPFREDAETLEKYGRIDIRYRTIAAKHVIVELKRASVRPDIYELARQGASYVDALRDTLAPEEKDRAAIEVVFVVGPTPTDTSERIENAMNSVAPGSRIVTYQLLTSRAQAAYAAYLVGAREADRIAGMFDPSAAEAPEGTGTSMAGAGGDGIGPDGARTASEGHGRPPAEKSATKRGRGVKKRSGQRRRGKKKPSRKKK
ncbi:MAG: ATP-binding protein [Phycisphaeraceae bacterium]|nr:ATP-binding protein [Phycisphaeraceae bacterium]